MTACGQPRFIFAIKLTPFHFPHHRTFVGLLNQIALPRLVPEHSRVRQQVANFTRCASGGQSWILFVAAFSAGCWPFLQNVWAFRPAVKVARNLTDKDLPAIFQRIQKCACPTVKFIKRPGRNGNTIRQCPINLVNGDLWLGFEGNFIGDISFFRRSGSSAQSLGR